MLEPEALARRAVRVGKIRRRLAANLLHPTEVARRGQLLREVSPTAANGKPLRRHRIAEVKLPVATASAAARVPAADRARAEVTGTGRLRVRPIRADRSRADMSGAAAAHVRSSICGSRSCNLGLRWETGEAMKAVTAAPKASRATAEVMHRPVITRHRAPGTVDIAAADRTVRPVPAGDIPPAEAGTRGGAQGARIRSVGAVVPAPAGTRVQGDIIARSRGCKSHRSREGVPSWHAFLFAHALPRRSQVAMHVVFNCGKFKVNAISSRVSRKPDCRGRGGRSRGHTYSCGNGRFPIPRTGNCRANRSPGRR